jgi:hypothetical protein
MVGQLASRCPSVLVNETTEAIDPDDLGCIRFAPHPRRPNWRPLAECAVNTAPSTQFDAVDEVSKQDGAGPRGKSFNLPHQFRLALAAR